MLLSESIEWIFANDGALAPRGWWQFIVALGNVGLVDVEGAMVGTEVELERLETGQTTCRFALTRGVPAGGPSKRFQRTLGPPHLLA